MKVDHTFFLLLLHPGFDQGFFSETQELHVKTVLSNVMLASLTGSAWAVFSDECFLRNSQLALLQFPVPHPEL